LSEDGFYESDPDVDTGPVHVVTPTDEEIAVEEGDWPPQGNSQENLRRQTCQTRLDLSRAAWEDRVTRR
jgi:hypothetical protein